MTDRSPGTALVWLAAAVLGGFLLLRLGDGGGQGEAPRPVRIAGGAGPPARRAGPTGNLVHVAGAVRRPGLVRVPQGARVAVAVRRAGGPARGADLDSLNLAARVDDGQQVVVPSAGPGGPGAAAAKPSLGTATAEELDGIDGIGPTLAQRIVEHRTESGGFGSLQELSEVDGIGDKRLEALREALQP
ncbi:MAG: helix-hairpin-helix domain-containing protein [Thermoleophilaceae bacterium]|nr:helix-hairpin-helix domain-containing protein [Thermoleophilaceae bacterium]